MVVDPVSISKHEQNRQDKEKKKINVSDGSVCDHPSHTTTSSSTVSRRWQQHNLVRIRLSRVQVTSACLNIARIALRQEMGNEVSELGDGKMRHAETGMT